MFYCLLLVEQPNLKISLGFGREDVLKSRGFIRINVPISK